MTQHRPYTDQKVLFATEMNSLTVGLTQNGVIYGCDCTADGVDMYVDVTAGLIQADGTRTAVTAGSVQLSNGDATNPRWDIVTVNTTGTLGKVEGTPAANPVIPDYPASQVVLCSVLVPATATTISNSDIFERARVELPPPVVPASYMIFTDGTTIYAVNGSTGIIDYSGTDADSVIQSAINALTSGGRVFIKAGTYTINTAITALNNIEFCGEGIGNTILFEADGANLDRIYYISGKNHCSVHDMTMDGNKANQTTGTSVFEIRNSSSWVDAYNLECKNGRSGIITIVDSNYINIHDCLSTDTNANQPYGVRNVWYSRFHNLWAMNATNNWGFDFSETCFSTISNLYMEGSAGTGIKIDMGSTESDICKGLTVSNLILNNAGSGATGQLQINYTQDSTFKNIITNSGDFNIRISDSSGLTFSGGKLWYGSNHNIYITSSALDIIIEGFIIDGGGSSSIGIQCAGDDCIFASNRIKNRTGSSINFTADASNNIAHGNRISTAITDAGTDNQKLDNWQA